MAFISMYASAPKELPNPVDLSRIENEIIGLN